MLAGAVMNLGCYVVLLQSRLSKYQSRPPAQNHKDVVKKRVAHRQGTAAACIAWQVIVNKLF